MSRTSQCVTAIHLLLSLLALFGNSHCTASVMTYTNKVQWQGAVGNNYTTVNFVGFPHGTFITNQYSNLGVTFTDGDDSIFLNQVFLNDGAGLDGNGNINVSFLAPQFWIGTNFPGLLTIQLYQGNTLVYAGATFGGGGQGFFAGLVSTESFNRAVLIDPLGEAEIDDLYFGPPIPAPGVLGVLVLAALGGRSRRRR